MSKGLSLDYIITKGGNNLSIIQKEKICLGRAIYGKSDLLILI